MKHLSHKNIVNYLGVSEETADHPLSLLLEFLPSGDLKQYLSTGPNSKSISRIERLFHCVNVASGMSYLANKNFIHRDLAARNVMLANALEVPAKDEFVDNDFGFPMCKISDFGLARKNDDNEQYVMEGMGPLPVRWMAIEAITNRTFTEKSDVWSYGVVVYELFTRATVPYSEINTFSIVATIASGTRLQRPESCPEYIWEFVFRCFSQDPKDRPTFQESMFALVFLFCFDIESEP
eukprot:Pgem_evm1s5505